MARRRWVALEETFHHHSFASQVQQIESQQVLCVEEGRLCDHGHAEEMPEGTAFHLFAVKC